VESLQLYLNPTFIFYPLSFIFLLKVNKSEKPVKGIVLLKLFVTVSFIFLLKATTSNTS